MRVVLKALLLTTLGAHAIRAVAPRVAMLDLPRGADPARAVDAGVGSGVAGGAVVVYLVRVRVRG